MKRKKLKEKQTTLPASVSESPRAIAARANSQLSTGPRTDEGKSIACRNAITHGLYATPVVIPELGESQNEYDVQVKTIVEHFKPRDAYESTLCHEIAECFWRLRRVRAYRRETTSLALKHADSAAMAAFVAGRNITIEDIQRRCHLPDTRHQNKADRVHNRLLRQIRDLSRELRQARGDNTSKDVQISVLLAAFEPQRDGERQNEPKRIENKAKYLDNKGIRGTMDAKDIRVIDVFEKKASKS